MTLRRLAPHLLQGITWRYGAIALPRYVCLYDGQLWECVYYRAVTCTRPPGDDSHGIIWRKFGAKASAEAREPAVAGQS